MKKLASIGLSLAGIWILSRWATRIEIDLAVFFIASWCAAMYFAGSFQHRARFPGYAGDSQPLHGSPVTLATISQQLANLYLLTAFISQVYSPEDRGATGVSEEDSEQRSRRMESVRERRAWQLDELTELLQRDFQISAADAAEGRKLQFWGHCITFSALASGQTAGEALAATNEAWDKHERWIKQYEGQRIRNNCMHQGCLDHTKHKKQYGDKACPECEALAQAAEKSFRDYISVEK